MKTKSISICLISVLFLVVLSGCQKDSQLTTVKLNEVTHSIFYAP